MTKTLSRPAGASFLFAGILLFSALTRAEPAPGAASSTVPMIETGDAVAEETHEGNAHKDHSAHDTHPAHHNAHGGHKAKNANKYKTVHVTPYGGRWGVRADLLGALALTVQLGDFTKGKTITDGIKVSGNFAVPVRVSGTYGVTDALELFLALGTAQKVAKIAGDDIPFGLLYSLGFGFRYYINTDDPVKLFIAPSIHVGYGNGVSAGFDGQAGLQFQLIDELAMALQSGLIFAPASFQNLNQIQVAPYVGVGFHYHF
jgi:hypothetical protein